MTTTSPIPINQLNFEQALKELEVIVQQLEQGDVALDKSITIYERGAALKQHCESLLKDAQLRVEQIVLNSDASISAEPVDIK